MQYVLRLRVACEIIICPNTHHVPNIDDCCLIVGIGSAMHLSWIVVLIIMLAVVGVGVVSYSNALNDASSGLNSGGLDFGSLDSADFGSVDSVDTSFADNFDSTSNPTPGNTFPQFTMPSYLGK